MWKKVFACQLKLLRRDWVVRLFIVIVIAIVPVMQFVCLENLHIMKRVAALPSFIPFLSSILFDYLQSLFVIFIAYPGAMRDKIKKSLEMIYVRPVSNVGYLAGKTTALMLFFVSLNVFVLLVGMGLHLYMGYSSLRLWMYIFYLVTLTLPSLCFWLGFSSFVGSLTRNKGGMLIVLLLWGVSCFYMPGIRHGVFDFTASRVPCLFSDVVGNPFVGEYLWHRSCYFLLGIGFWCLSVLRFGRLENGAKISYRLGFVGCTCVLLGGYVGWSYDRYYVNVDERREEYREVYTKYRDKYRVRVPVHEIECRQVKDSLYAESRITVRNASGKAIQEFVLFLNPWLTVSELTDEKEELSFARDQQVIRVRRSLMPEEEATLTLKYRGKVDGAFCYLELKDQDYYQREFPFSRLYYDWFLRFGQVYVFLSPDFTLLYPDCLWYPSPVAPESMGVLGGRDCEFTRYTLGVQKKDKMEVVSQGKREDAGDRVVFRNEEDLPGISLCVGNFERWCLETDTLNVELFHFRDHEFFMADLKYIDGTPKELLENNLELWKREYRRDYPFKEFKAIETPVCFASHEREGGGSNNYLQPGMLFWPESGVTFREMIVEPGIADASMTFYDLFLQDMYKLRPLFYEFTGRLVDKRYPAIDYLFGEIMKVGCKDFSDKYENIALVEACEDYLSRKSLQEAAMDKHVTGEEFREMIRLSADYLSGYLTASCGDGVLISIYRDFWNRNLFKRVEFDVFCQEYQLKTGVDLGDVVEKLYTKKQLPRFRVTDVRKGSKILPEDWRSSLMSYKVYNDSDVDGVISTHRGLEESEWGNRQQFYSYIIKARSCKEIRVVKFVKDKVRFYTHLSQHLPLTFEKEVVIDANLEGKAGVFDCDTNCFAVVPGEIVVDDQDEGFRLVHPEVKLHLLSLFQKEVKNNNKDLRNRVYPARWTRFYREQFYGFPRRSAWCKMVGEGKSNVEWGALLPKAGRYGVFVYIPKLKDLWMDHLPDGMTLFYMVAHAGGETEVPVVLTGETRQWVSLGEFYFDEGIAKIVLNDRTKSDLPDKVREMWVVADAVKWKYVGQ